ncbi:MAG: accessory factor UbiK family protein [Gammaproteobacteria bacterium]
MFDFAAIEKAAERITALLPSDPRILREEFRHAVRPLLEGMLTRMDLVTREEYDAQAAVLRRTREKLEALEQDIAELERRAGDTA